jgi:integrase
LWSWVQIPPRPLALAPTTILRQYEEFLKGRVRKATARGYRKILNVLRKLGPLGDLGKMRAIICNAPVSEGRKELYANAYDHYCQLKGLAWDKPKFVREDKPFFLPVESELDGLIANTRHKMSTFLQLLKETGIEPGEAWKLRWIDIDIQRKTVAITPTKNHNARVLPISGNLLSRLLKLPRKNGRVFASENLDKFRWLYERARNQLSEKLEDPRLHEVAFRSFRHWKATTEYAKTKDILHVKWLLGHKRIENTLVYTHLMNFESDEYCCKVAKTVDEASQRAREAGYEYVTEVDGSKLFRKRKQIWLLLLLLLNLLNV